MKNNLDELKKECVRKQQFNKLIYAQDILRKVYCVQSPGHLYDSLKKIDKDLSKAINILGGMIPE